MLSLVARLVLEYRDYAAVNASFLSLGIFEGCLALLGCIALAAILLVDGVDRASADGIKRRESLCGTGCLSCRCRECPLSRLNCFAGDLCVA